MTTFEEKKFKNPNDPFLYHLDKHTFDFTRANLNWHESIEILCIVSGSAEVSYDSQLYPIYPGEIAVIEPYTPHNIFTSDKETTYHVLTINKNFLKICGIDISKISFQKTFSDEEIKNDISALAKAYYDDDEYSALRNQMYISKIFWALCTHHSFQTPSEHMMNRVGLQRIQNVILYVKSNYGKDINLHSAAKHFSTSKEHLSREFKKYTNITLTEYINFVRCKEAKKLLSKGEKVSTSAEQVGFNNLSYFTKTYRRIMGNNPSSDMRLNDVSYKNYDKKQDGKQ